MVQYNQYIALNCLKLNTFFLIIRYCNTPAVPMKSLCFVVTITCNFATSRANMFIDCQP